jgi:hypothetical protein
MLNGSFIFDFLCSAGFHPGIAPQGGKSENRALADQEAAPGGAMSSFAAQLRQDCPGATRVCSLSLKGSESNHP